MGYKPLLAHAVAMNADSFRDDLRAARDTELSRLSSSKAVYALTGGEMDGDAVRAGTARELAALASTLERWADQHDGDAGDLFAAAAELAAEYAATFDGDAAADDADEPRHVVVDALDGRDDEISRLAGAAAALLVLDDLAGQLVGFFVGDADRQSADQFRTFRGELGEYGDEAAELLADRCETEPDEDAAREAGAAVVDGAYDWYVATLESMGVEPKNVC